MLLSIVIVNYNVKYFLEQCLESVYSSDTALQGTPDGESLQLEVFVVDNASVDGSVEMVRERFPQARLIANTDNVGFARANNQALRLCRGDLVLLLNPDTVVEHDTFSKCAGFYASHPDCGGLTVKMINGEGEYLRESKRGFPTPAASFFKMSGLIRLFPHSRLFAAYYMGHLDDNDTNPIDILPGAFLMISRQALEKVGLLDESYFMYGEDIDFSWRIKLAGFENYYYPHTRIIHYKGESTKRGSMNYVYTFYNAMSIFVKRYFSGSNASFFNLLLHLAIWGRATVAWLKRVLQAIALPAADFAVAFAGFWAIKQLWASYWADNIHYYPPQYTYAVIPCYILLLMLCSWINGGYEKPVRMARIAKGMTVGTALLLVFYSLLDESQRYSRALLLAGCLWTPIAALGIRGILHLLHVPGFDLGARSAGRCIIVGSSEEAARVQRMYQTLDCAQIAHVFGPQTDAPKLIDAIRIHNADEVVFCNKDLTVHQIIDLMTQLSRSQNLRQPVAYKIAPSGSDFIIGSNTINSTEDLYTEQLHPVVSPLNRRNKRMLDIVAALLLLLSSPFLFWFQRRKRLYYAHCWQVLTGKKTWVGIRGNQTRPGIFGPENMLCPLPKYLPADLKLQMHLRYLQNYKVSTDLHILAKNLFYI